MADKKITQLNSLTQADTGDLFAIVDISSPETKKISAENLFGAPLPIGNLGASTGQFTTLELGGFVVVNEFSTDGTLSGDSDSAVPTEKAVKTYVDTQILGASNKIYQLDSSVEVIDVGSGSIVFTVDSAVQATINSSGLALASGIVVNEISNDPTLFSASMTSLITEYAAKQYVDIQKDRIYDGIAIARILDSTSSSFYVDLRDNIFPLDSTSSTETYYFNDETSSTWSNPTNMVDGNTSTFASIGGVEGTFTQINTSNTSLPSVTRNVKKVEVRVYGKSGNGPHVDSFKLYPVFSGIQGDSHNLKTFLNLNASWTPWIDITKDPSAPSEWVWQDVIDLDTKIEATISSPGGSLTDTLEIGSIEIRVTYTTESRVSAAYEKFRVSIDGISVAYGATIDEFSVDTFLTDSSDKAVPTERAVKIYVDDQIDTLKRGVDVTNTRFVSNDSTSFTGDVCLVNTSGGNVSIQIFGIPDGKISIKKISTDSNIIIVTSLMGYDIDGEAMYIIDTPYQATTFLTTGSGIYII